MEARIVPVEQALEQIRQDREREVNVPRLAIVYQGRQLIDVPITEVIGDRDPQRIEDPELINLAEARAIEDHPNLRPGFLGDKVSINKPRGGQGNIVIGPQNLLG